MSLLDVSFEEKLEVLNAVQLMERFPLALSLLQRQVTVGEALALP